jgi:hypothetical protein
LIDCFIDTGEKLVADTVDSCNTLVDCFIDAGKILVANTVDSCNKLVDNGSLILAKKWFIFFILATNWLTVDCREGVGEGLVGWIPFLQEFYTLYWPDPEPTKLLDHPQTKI